MLRIGLLIATACSVVRGSGFVPVAGPAPAPVVTAASSQYFQRTFNRLVAAAPVQPVVPVVPAPPVFVQPVTKTVPVNPTESVPSGPNIAIAIAHAAAPVATILLPPFPFGPPPGLAFIPPAPAPDTKEPTTQKSTTEKDVTTRREPETTTQVPSNSDNNFVQALPSNENVKFKQYYAPPFPLPLPNGKPQKLKTSVEVVPVPLTYIAPPPLAQPLKTKHAKQYHAYAPAKKVIRLVKVRTVRVPARIIIHSAPVHFKKASLQYKKNGRSLNLKQREPTTWRPQNRPLSKPPRL